MKRSIYPEPDGYLKMRVRDIIAGALVVSCFALAIVLNYIWQNVLGRIARRLRIKYENQVS